MGERAFHHYTTWEDWQNGLYRAEPVTAEAVRDAAGVLALSVRCRAAMQRVVREWPRATEQHLTDPTCNRRAWLGRASMCIETGHGEAIGRPAWFTLTQREMDRANAIADEVIEAWERKWNTRRQGDLFERSAA